MQWIGSGFSATVVRQSTFQISKNKVKSAIIKRKELLGGIGVYRLKKDTDFCEIARKFVNESNFGLKIMFYDPLVDTHSLADRPERGWNLDEAGFSYFTKAFKAVPPKGTKRKCEDTATEKGATVTVLPRVNAAGQRGPCVIIFKGQRLSSDLKEGAPADNCVTMSKNCWINNGIFYNSLQHFFFKVPNERPVLILMDSHTSHVSPEGA
jgi:hypothetical protein